MNKLPELPKQHTHKEADFGIELKHYVEKNGMESRSFELKHAHGKNSLPFKEIKNEQIAYANAISSERGAWIRTLGMNGEPDYVWLCNEPADIVIKYPLGFCFIPIGNLLFEKQKSKRKSLTWERACDIAWKVIKTKKSI